MDLHPCTPAICAGPLPLPAPAAVSGRVVLLGIDLDPFEAFELSEALAAAAEEAAGGERLALVPLRKE